ncbi:MAG: CCA tRNA nucleotidyltransferase [Pelagibacteraceae bacterium]|jgi:poly(A) polymerase|nr:poly(A) polymerase [Candidatus Pelagibacter sp.]MDP6681246.1 CCA tRNA nucleotidyltransferase [Pelagibacteraceae bacterium]MDP6710209.1 CCA tRNA nucleotidyltransferase [Pelagibacteraceae bacterium]
MFKKLKKIISKTDRSLFKKFGSDKSLKLLENMTEARTIFSYLNEIGEESKVRFVGGCVRKSLCGEYIDDIDLATSLEPNEVKKKLDKNDVKVMDTGISYGTVTAIVNKKKFEITTLRKDVSTDGRHARVEFTRNWEQDASRRDFTINAIYADLDGRILDPLNGVLDLQNGRINFIGSPEERIQEDYLRILRYFRFFAQYSKTNCDQNTIQSIKKNIDGINKISKERIFDELKKILSLKNVYNLFKNNQSKEIILNIFPEFKYPERLDKISNLDQNLREKYDNFLILALLLVDQSNNHEYFCHKYKTSKSIENRLNNISKNLENLKNKQFYSEENIKKLIYLSDKYYVRDLLLFSICINSKIKTLNVERLIDYAEVCKIPKFPISGDYLKKHGYESGAKLGKVLKSLEEKWIAENFNLDEKVLKKIIK